MAVTINQMDVDVQGGKPKDQAPAAAAGASKEPANIRQEMEKHTERQLRLRAD